MNPTEVVERIVCYVGCDRQLRIIVAGPCAVGKTRVAEELVSIYPQVNHIEHDSLKLSSLGSPCWPIRFDPDACFASRVEACLSGFVIDLGGDTVFRQSANNNDRLSRMKTFKQKHAVTIVLLTARCSVLRERFLRSKDRIEGEFDGVWQNWESIEKPYWLKCADLEIDTS